MRLLLLCLVACGRVGFDARNTPPPADSSPGDGAPGDSSGLPHNLVFVTSDQYHGDLGGLAGADAICMQHATAGGHSGTFVAWLSTSTVNAKDRLVIPATSTPARGWVRQDGRPVADQLPDLLTGTMYYPIRLDERGNDQTTGPAREALTGSTTSGTFDSSQGQCSDWNSADPMQLYTFGDIHRTTDDWTSNSTDNCSTASGRLYCFQIDYDNPVTLSPTPGRIAFVSEGTINGAAGTAAADTMCASEASGRFTGSFKALLSTTARTAASVFSTTGPTWVRPDGIPLAATPQDVLAFTLEAPIGQLADGTYIALQVWNGSTSPTVTAAGANDDCQDWATAASGAQGIIGASVSTTSGWGQSPDGCNRTLHVYCLQQ